MAGRGEYSAIHTAVVDAADFQALGPDARLCFYTLKMILGPSGIEVVRCFVAQMEQLTGLSGERLGAALNELSGKGWLAKQGDVVWLRNGLKHNPNVNLANEKHRTGVTRHLEGLPRSEIVNAFCKHYSLPEIAIGMGIEWVSVPYGIQVIGKGEGKGEGKGNSPVLSERAQEAPKIEFDSGKFAQFVRRYLWLGKEPPPLLTAKRPSWSMANEISIGEQWQSDYGGWDVVCGMVPLIRSTCGYEDDLPISCLYLHTQGKRNTLNEVHGRYVKELQAVSDAIPLFPRTA